MEPLLHPVLNYIENIQEGYSEGTYLKKTYGITKTTFNSGKSYKIYGDELGGTNFISLNYYITKERHFLKPCEMPKEKVVEFLKSVVLKSCHSKT
jgi:hypothetical protein